MKKTFKEIRQSKGISLTFVAKYLSKTEQTVRNKENGLTNFTWAEGCLLCKLYNVDMAEIKI